MRLSLWSNRRWLSNGLRLALLWGGVSTFAAAATRLAVFYPTTTPVPDIAKALKADKALEGSDVLPFAKFVDFAAAEQGDPSPYLMVPWSYVDVAAGCEPVGVFGLGGKTTFQYLVLSLDGTWTESRLGDATLGVVEELERKDSKTFVEKVLGKAPKSIKKVSKIEDLLPLLALENADVIMISPNLYEETKGKITAKTNVVMKSKEVSYPVLCKRKDAAPDKANALLGLSPETVKALGFDVVERFGKGGK